MQLHILQYLQELRTHGDMGKMYLRHGVLSTPCPCSSPLFLYLFSFYPTLFENAPHLGYNRYYICHISAAQISTCYSGYVYKFHRNKETIFACASCKKLGKSRTITVQKGRIIGVKHPEDDHHPTCRSIPVEEVAKTKPQHGLGQVAQHEVRIIG